MLPPQAPLAIYRGDSSAWLIRLWADEGRTEAFDLTGAVVAAQIRPDYDARRAVPLAVEVVLPNEVTLRLDAAASARTPPGRWDLRLTWPDGRVVTAVAGPVTVTPDVTRDD